MLDAEAIKNAAVQRTGLEDFGEPSFDEALLVLIDSLNREANLNAFGISFFEANLIDTLSSRLEVLEASRNAPATPKRSGSGPIFIVGTGRTGSTLLHATLNASRRNCSLDHALEHTKILRQLDNSPISCTDIFSHTLKSIIYFHLAYVPTYFEWFISGSYDEIYQFHRDVVQLVPGQESKTWVFKSSQHAFSMTELARSYPSAKIVHMHRDPLRAYYSRNAAAHENLQRHSDSPNHEGMDQIMMEMTKVLISRMTEFRESAPSPVFDLVYEEFLRSPMERISDLYGFFNLELDEDSLRRIEAFVATEHDGTRAQRRDVRGLDTPPELRALFAYLTRTYSIPSSLS